MKFVISQISYFLTEKEARQNIRALSKYLAFLAALIALYSVVFHLIMLHMEGQYHSWMTGVYWTLTVMTTLGFGDITFTSDIGRLFSIVVLLSGIVLLLILLPFMFIRLFYAPWLEAQVRLRAPREAPENVGGHVIICNYDTIAAGLIERLRLHGIPYFVIEPDYAAAARMHGDGISVIAGEIDSSATYRKLRVSQARLVLANSSDTVNTNIILTVREVAPNVPIIGRVEDEDSIDILELSGCNYVLPLHQKLGARLAGRVNAGHAETHVIGRIHNLVVAGFRRPQHTAGGAKNRRNRPGRGGGGKYHRGVGAWPFVTGGPGYAADERKCAGGRRDRATIARTRYHSRYLRYEL